MKICDLLSLPFEIRFNEEIKDEASAHSTLGLLVVDRNHAAKKREDLREGHTQTPQPAASFCSAHIQTKAATAEQGTHDSSKTTHWPRPPTSARRRRHGNSPEIKAEQLGATSCGADA